MSENENQIAIFDLDGTLANIEHRLHFISDKRAQDWDGFFAASKDDLPIVEVISIAQALYERYIIWIFSGRSDAVRTDTEAWLKNNGVPYNFLQMRLDGDYTRDADLKLSWVKKYELTADRVPLVFDDRDQVVKMWRANGFRCLQVAPGEF